MKVSGLLPTMVIMLSVLMLGPALAAETYDVWVYGVQFTSDNAGTGIACGEGKATYNNSTQTITFTDCAGPLFLPSGLLLQVPSAVTRFAVPPAG